MSKKRIKTSTQVPTKEDFFAWVDEIAALQVDVACRAAARDAELQAVRERHEAPIREQEAQQKALMKAAQRFMKDNEAEVLATGLRSGETSLARFGLRLGQPTIACIADRSFTCVLRDLIELGDEGKEYLTFKEPTLDKEAIRLHMPEEMFARMGLRHRQGETFWVEHKESEEQ